MAQLILPRRSFLLGAVASLAAPAIVRASSLMPVKAQLGLRPAFFTEPQAIADAFARCLWQAGMRPGTAPLGVKQQYLGLIGQAPAGLTGAEISAAANKLAAEAGGNNIPWLPFPDQTIGSYNGVQVRYTLDYSITSDALINSFDLITN